MATSESARLARGRPMPPGFVPELSVEGTTRDAGRQLGAAWRETLELSASQLQSGSKPWWKHRPYARLIDRYAPHLPDLYLGLARGANLKEDLISTRAPVEVGGCTSFAITPGAILSASAGTRP